jgi:hypothetical protein
MSSKTAILIGVTIGSTIGGYLPAVWGGSLFSFSSVILSAVGGTIGLIITYKMVT